MATLSKLDGFSEFHQDFNWAIATFTRGLSGIDPEKLSFLNPHVFVIQVSEDFTIIKINRNPSEEQMRKVRDFLEGAKQLMLNCK